MRYLIVDFKEKQITWKDTLELKEECINEGYSAAYGDEYDAAFWSDLDAEIKHVRKDKQC